MKKSKYFTFEGTKELAGEGASISFLTEEIAYNREHFSAPFLMVCVLCFIPFPMAAPSSSNIFGSWVFLWLELGIIWLKAPLLCAETSSYNKGNVKPNDCPLAPSLQVSTRCSFWLISTCFDTGIVSLRKTLSDLPGHPYPSLQPNSGPLVCSFQPVYQLLRADSPGWWFN